MVGRGRDWIKSLKAKIAVEQFLTGARGGSLEDRESEARVLLMAIDLPSTLGS